MGLGGVGGTQPSVAGGSAFPGRGRLAAGWAAGAGGGGRWGEAGAASAAAGSRKGVRAKKEEMQATASALGSTATAGPGSARLLGSSGRPTLASPVAHAAMSEA